MALVTLSPQQEAALKSVTAWFKDAAPHNYNGEWSATDFYLGGLAGTGKSTVLPTIIEALRLDPESVEFCAPTAKAAKVMGSKLKAAGINKRPRTIHSLIYQPRPLKAEVLEKQLEGLLNTAEEFVRMGYLNDDEQVLENAKSIEMTRKDLDKAYNHVEGPRFTLNMDSAIRNALLVVVDEASMVGSEMASDLRIFGVPLFVMGDPGQLKPVGDTPGFTNRDPDYFLTEVHRQAKDNPILHLAHLAREGRELPIGKMVHGDFFAEVVDRRNDTATYDESREAQLICGTNRKRWNITQKLRSQLGFRSQGPEEGEPMIVCRNSKKHPDMVNGSMVQCLEDVGDLEEGSNAYVIKVEDELGVKREIIAVQGLLEEHYLKQKNAASCSKQAAFRAKMDYEHLDWGWVLTCHKSQGSQWEDVIVHDESGVFDAEARNWLYTALTRASDRLTVVV